MIVEPIRLADEERLEIPLTGTGINCLVISGYAEFNLDANDARHSIHGDEDDDGKALHYTAHMVVGPTWLGVRDVSPVVALAGYYHGNPDEADIGGYDIQSCTWDTVGLPPPNTNLEQIRLKVELEIRGGIQHKIQRLAYHLVANGVLSGES